MDFPMRAQYLGIWLGSEHIKAGDGDVFLLDPCSATIVEWPEMERGDECTTALAGSRRSRGPAL